MTILLGFSPGKPDHGSLELAATLAGSAGQDLLVVTVVPAPWPTPVAGNTDRELVAWADEQGSRAATEATELLAALCPDLPASATWVPGRSVPTALMEKAGEVGASMIVVGSGSAGTAGRVDLGATGDRLLHSSDLPVAIAPGDYSMPAGGKVSRATCAFRGDEQSFQTLQLASVICVDVGASLRVATFAVRGRTMYPPETGIRDEDMVMEQWLSQATAAQQKALDNLPGDGLGVSDVETVIARGATWAESVDSIDWAEGDVLVIGSSSASFVERIFLGSNATKIVRNSPVPVIVVP